MVRRGVWLGALATIGILAIAAMSFPNRLLTPASTVSAETLAAGIAVSGEGNAKAAPDMASMNLGVSARGSTAREAMAQAGTLMTQVVERIKGLGIPEQDIQTSDISMYPQHDQNSRVIGYEARTSVNVTVRDLNKAVWVLDGAVEAGANQTYGISFGLQNPEALHLLALQDAIRAARARADTIAASLGVRIVGRTGRERRRLLRRARAAARAGLCAVRRGPWVGGPRRVGPNDGL